MPTKIDIIRNEIQRLNVEKGDLITRMQALDETLEALNYRLKLLYEDEEAEVEKEGE